MASAHPAPAIQPLKPAALGPGMGAAERQHRPADQGKAEKGIDGHAENHQLNRSVSFAVTRRPECLSEALKIWLGGG